MTNKDFIWDILCHLVMLSKISHNFYSSKIRRTLVIMKYFRLQIIKLITDMFKYCLGELFGYVSQIIKFLKLLFINNIHTKLITSNCILIFYFQNSDLYIVIIQNRFLII